MAAARGGHGERRACDAGLPAAVRRSRQPVVVSGSTYHSPPAVRPSGETKRCGKLSNRREGQKWLFSVTTASGSARPGLSGGKNEVSMRFSRAWLAAVPALAIALTGDDNRGRCGRPGRNQRRSRQDRVLLRRGVLGWHPRRRVACLGFRQTTALLGAGRSSDAQPFCSAGRAWLVTDGRYGDEN